MNDEHTPDDTENWLASIVGAFDGDPTYAQMIENMRENDRLLAAEYGEEEPSSPLGRAEGESMTDEEIEEAVAAFYEEYFDVGFSNVGTETRERWLTFARSVASRVRSEALEEAAGLAEEAVTGLPLETMPRYDEGYDRACMDNAKAIRALVSGSATGEEK